MIIDHGGERGVRDVQDFEYSGHMQGNGQIEHFIFQVLACWLVGCREQFLQASHEEWKRLGGIACRSGLPRHGRSREPGVRPRGGAVEQEPVRTQQAPGMGKPLHRRG